MSDLFRPNIAHLRGYVPGEQPREKGYIKLNTNENPYPPSPLVLARLRDACAADLRLYPDPDAWALRRKLGEV
ncbi:MAG: histidinol-phosphate transaminase, partial [Gemmatimonadetes bacterium]|nr:histidinol-phosphate transaminase [Gemmatimonadota bacterium]